MNEPNRTKNSILIVALSAAVVILLVVLLFTTTKNLPHPPPVPGSPDRDGPSRHERPGALKDISGVVTGYMHNIHRDVCGLQIRTGSRGILGFQFRPHTAQAVLAVAGLNDTVLVSYDSRPDDEQISYRLRTVRNERRNSAVDPDHLPPPPRVPPGEPARTFDLRDPEIISDSFGGIAALRKDRHLFHFRPEQVDEIGPLIHNGHLFSLLAIPRGMEQGFVNIDHEEVFIVVSITIDNKTFMLR